MERTSVSRVARWHARRPAAGGLRRLRLRLEPIGALARWLAVHWTEVAAVTAAAGFAFWIGHLSIARHEAFQSNAYDLGFFDQIIWNTSQGRLFATSFVHYNFLGQHFEPVLLLFALVYRLGGGVESLLVVQAFFAGVAAIPLYFGARRVSGSAVAGLAVALAYLVNPSLHEAVNHDFHPEVLALAFVFLALYFMVAERPRAAVLSLLPLLALKEEMVVLLIAFAVLMFARGYRRQAKTLAAVGIAWALVMGIVVMTLIRGGASSDLTRRYDYLYGGSDGVRLAADVVERTAVQLAGAPLEGFASLLGETGFVALLSPVGAALSLVVGVPAGLSNHPEQAGLRLHYVVPSLALIYVACVLALGRLRASRLLGGRILATGAAGVVLAASLFAFMRSSPYAPGEPRPSLTAAHAAALREALSLIPPDAPVSAQSAILPHLSTRRRLSEFPRIVKARYVVVDGGLPASTQSLADGFKARLEALPLLGYREIFAREGVRVFALP